MAGIAALANQASAAGRAHHESPLAKAHWHNPHVSRVAHDLTPRDVALRRSQHVSSRDHGIGDTKVGEERPRGERRVARAASSEGRQSFSGLASYYSEGQRVASGGAFNASGFTCAHRSLPFGTHLRVADPRSGRSVVVTVNDRGPFVHGRVLDLSLGAARALGMTGRGVMHVSASVI